MREIIGPHRGPIPYKFQQLGRGVWRWTVYAPKVQVDRAVAGLAYSRRAAKRAAKNLIDRIAPKNV